MSITVLTNLVMSAGSYDKRDPVLPYSAGRRFEESDNQEFQLCLFMFWVPGTFVLHAVVLKGIKCLSIKV